MAVSWQWESFSLVFYLLASCTSIVGLQGRLLVDLSAVKRPLNFYLFIFLTVFHTGASAMARMTQKMKHLFANWGLGRRRTLSATQPHLLLLKKRKKVSFLITLLCFAPPPKLWHVARSFTLFDSFHNKRCSCYKVALISNCACMWNVCFRCFKNIFCIGVDIIDLVNCTDARHDKDDVWQPT